MYGMMYGMSVWMMDGMIEMHGMSVEMMYGTSVWNESMYME